MEMSTTPAEGYWTNYSYATQRATGWQIVEAKTGLFIKTYEGHILARVAGDSIYLWDRHAKAEVQVGLDYLKMLAE